MAWGDDTKANCQLPIASCCFAAPLLIFALKPALPGHVFHYLFSVPSVSATNMSDNTFMPLQRPAVPNRSPRSSRERLHTRGAGEGSAPLLSRATKSASLKTCGADSSASPQTERRNDATLLARSRNGMLLFGGWLIDRQQSRSGTRRLQGRPLSIQVSGHEFTRAKNAIS